MGEQAPEFEAMYQAVSSRDARFDGRFYTAVTSTGIYCRPICPARTPRRQNVRFFEFAAAAQAAGFRACRRCRPDRSPGSPEWNFRADLTGRALRLIADGAADEEGVAGVARRLAVSERHLHRTLVAEVGVGPLALARTRRAQTARILIESTRLPLSDVAFAAGYASIRQFNDSVKEAFGRTPSELRVGDPPPPGSAIVGEGTITVRLAYRSPIDIPALFGWFGARAIPGVEEVGDGEYRRTLRLPHGAAGVVLADQGGAVAAHVTLTDIRDLAAAVRRCRDLLDLDADPTAVSEVLSKDPVMAPLVAARPGLRVPGAADGFELAVRAVLGQQVSVAAARTFAGRIAERFGEPAECGVGPERLFPTAAAIADADLTGIGLTTKRAATLNAVAQAVALDKLHLDRGADREEARQMLLALPGIGPWTASYIALRALGDPDAFPVEDLVLRQAAARLSLPNDRKSLTAAAENWRPWRAYAALHLWASTADETEGKVA